ncbi:hypothetical protein [Paenibacillus agilis]|uniref:Uncharacterized protein n=1 Tax=Paenibacillus agilis TaxID=3020863 RepID=A0A559IEL7_9BACL|nr:hypothetical protein [Paenibacillus agilis]TVX86104.1 hypothetical protein FPZ44_24520 [Paenibacillus agilis]
MTEKVQGRRKGSTDEPKVDVKPKAIMHGIATTNLNEIAKGEKVDIYEDKGDEWLTDKGLVSKLFLLLKKI